MDSRDKDRIVVVVTGKEFVTIVLFSIGHGFA